MMPTTQLPSFQGMIGRSAPMQALFRRIERVAPIDVPVLILGEGGTGKARSWVWGAGARPPRTF